MLLALAPGVLGCHGWNSQHPGTQTDPNGQFGALSTPTPPAPAALVAIVVLPAALIGLAFVAARATARGTGGYWAISGNAWVWVPGRK